MKSETKKSKPALNRNAKLLIKFCEKVRKLKLDDDINDINVIADLVEDFLN